MPYRPALHAQGLKAVDGSIKKESDLPAADPNTPIPLKYEERVAPVEKGITLLLEIGQHRQPRPSTRALITGSVGGESLVITG